MRSRTADPARLGDLTDTQRRVLELIAEGKTNYEIGQALGITLDGAKYHVTEILNKLGVDSREEAATLVRPARWPSRLPGRRVAFAAAGIAAAMGILGIPLALRQDDGAMPEIQVAFLAGDLTDQTRQMTVVDGDGDTRTLGELGSFSLLEWAPNGQWLLASDVRPDMFEFHIHVYDARTGDRKSWESPGIPVGLDWSPDGSLIALCVLPEREAEHWTIGILRPDGATVASVELERRADEGAVTDPEITWSPDSEWILFSHARQMVLLSVSSESRTLPTPDSFPLGSVVVVDWTAAGLRIRAESSQPPLFGPRAWVLPNPGEEWQPIDAIPTPTTDSPEHRAVRERFEPAFTAGPPAPTADGIGWVYEFSPPLTRGNLRPAIEFVIVRFAGEEVRITAPQDVYAVSSISAVVVPR